MNREGSVYNFLLFTILFLAILVRALLFFQIPALWCDEALTANKLIFVPLKFLIQPEGSAHHIMHAYPVGFLALTKLMINIFGVSELSLRLIPFISGILALFIFRRLARIIFKPLWDLLALTLFSFSYPLIYHSFQLKPYSSDVFVAVILLLTSVVILKQKNQIDPVHVCIIGMYSLLFAFPAVFIVFPLIFLWVLDEILEKKYLDFASGRLKTFVFLSICQIAYFWFSLRHFLSDPQLKEFWGKNFVLMDAPAVIWENVYNFFPSTFMPILILLGIILIIRRSFWYAFVFLLPMMALFIAWLIQIYPFAERTILFLTPFFAILTTYGCEQFSVIFRRTGVTRLIASILIIFLLLPMFLKLFPLLNHFSFGEDVRPLVGFLKDNRMPNEDLYVNDLGEQSFRFYRFLIGEDNDDYTGTIGSGILNFKDKDGIFIGFEPDIEDISYLNEDGNFFILPDRPNNVIKPGRAWFLLAHTKPSKSILFNYLDSIGTQIMVKESDVDAVLYLYDIHHVPEPGELVLEDENVY